MKTGSCLCGGVKFEMHGDLRPVLFCHCTQCRKQSGHIGAFTSSEKMDFKLVSDKTLSWYRASNTASRGFCKICGSLLFWQGDGNENISIAAGSLNGVTGLKIEGHIYCADKGDYYEILDGDFQKQEWT